MKKIISAVALGTVMALPAMAQHDGLVDMSHSKKAVMVNTPLGATHWQ